MVPTLKSATMKRNLWIPLAFAGGLALGWFGGARGGGASAEPHAETETPRLRPERRAQPTTPESSRFAAKALSFIAMEKKEREDHIATMDLKEIGPLLIRLMDQAGPQGLPYQLHINVNQLIERWANENFEQAWRWADNCANHALASYAKSQLLDVLAKSDPDRALQIYLDTVKIDEDLRNSFPSKIIEEKVTEGAAAVISLLEQLPTGDGTFGMRLKYPDGFDFRTLLDGIKPFYESAGTTRPPIMPANVLGSWASSDPDAAHEWWTENRMRLFESWGNIFTEVELNRGPGAAGAWAAERWVETAPEQKQMLVAQLEGTGQTEGSVPYRVETIADALPPQEVDHFLKQVLIRHGFGPEAGADLADFMGRISDPSIRLEILTSAPTRRRPTSAQVSDELLSRWNISRAELEAAIQNQD